MMLEYIKYSMKNKHNVQPIFLKKGKH